MARRKFSAIERHAIWVAHDLKCWLCLKPVTFIGMEIEHVLPVDLVNQPESLAALISAFGLGTDFQIESYDNWRPAHGGCNNLKADLWAPVNGLQITGNRAKSKRAREIAESNISNYKLEKAIAAILSAVEIGRISASQKAVLDESLATFQSFQKEYSTAEEGGAVDQIGLRVLRDDDKWKIVRQPFGIGVARSGDILPHMRCAVCGNPYFNGVRCTNCGTMDDD